MKRRKRKRKRKNWQLQSVEEGEHEKKMTRSLGRPRKHYGRETQGKAVDVRERGSGRRRKRRKAVGA